MNGSDTIYIRVERKFDDGRIAESHMRIAGEFLDGAFGAEGILLLRIAGTRAKLAGLVVPQSAPMVMSNNIIACPICGVASRLTIPMTVPEHVEAIRKFVSDHADCRNNR